MKDEEIERRWLLATEPDILPTRVLPTQQVYVQIDDERAFERRIRYCAGHPQEYGWTEKTGSGIRRTEIKTQATAEDFAAALPKAIGSVNTKAIELYPHGELEIEIHRFMDRLLGLILIEIEFPSVEAAMAFQPLPWFGREVTDDPRFYGRNLARYGIPLSLPLLQHHSQTPEVSVQEGLTSVTEILRQRRNQVTIVGVAGGTASGKTSQIAAGIERAFPGQVLTITIDDYYRGTRALSALEALQGRSISWDEPTAVDLELLARHSRLLRQGQTVKAPVYDFPTSERVGTQTLHPQPIVVLEGLYALHETIRPWLDFGLYVEVDLHGQIIRRLLRDITRKGKAPNDILHYLATTVVPMHRQFVATTKPFADIVLRNDYRPESETARRGSVLPQLKIRDWPKIGHLSTLNADHVATPRQVDQYFTAQDRDLATTDESLRIRDESGELSMTYKGPVTGNHGERFVFTCSIEQSTVSALLQHYRSTLVRVDKIRNLYLIPGALVALDTVTLTSPTGPVCDSLRVTEVRPTSIIGPDDRQLHQILEALGFNPDLAVSVSYYDIALNPSLLPAT